MTLSKDGWIQFALKSPTIRLSNYVERPRRRLFGGAPSVGLRLPSHRPPASPVPGELRPASHSRAPDETGAASPAIVKRCRLAPCHPRLVFNPTQLSSDLAWDRFLKLQHDNHCLSKAF
ncbi:unnamed protein product [Urochloa humidicola]